MPALLERYWTATDVRALPDDGNRYECIAGELLVTPAPRALHQRAVFEVAVVVRAFVREHRLGEVLLSPADVELTPGDLVQPDLFVARARPGVSKIRDWREIAGLRVAIEVLSPSTARRDRTTKRAYLQRAGVGECWLVDLDQRAVERWVPGATTPLICRDHLRWAPVPGVALELDLRAYFADLLDD